MGGSTPNWSGYLDGVWAWPVEYDSSFAVLAGASNIVVGQNPPYTIQDFLGMYPKWGGIPIGAQGETTLGSPVVTLQDTTGIIPGNPAAGPGIPDGAIVLSVDLNAETVTLSANATASASQVLLTFWNAPIVPLAVIAAYIYVASASLVQARWLELWQFAMGLYISHFLTLYARSETDADGDFDQTASEAAAKGLAFGIQTSKAVHDVSVSYQPIITGLEIWGAWNLTMFGQQLITFAKGVGSGPMLIW